MTLQSAKRIADEIMQHLQPECVRIAPAADVRREKETIKTVELVCIPKGCKAEWYTIPDLFGGRKHVCKYAPYSQRFIASLAAFNIVKGNVHGKHVTINYCGNQVDVFMCSPDNWGYIYALRTGGKNTNMQLNVKLHSKGFELREGFVFKDGVPGIIESEEQLFALAGMNILEPKFRT